MKDHIFSHNPKIIKAANDVYEEILSSMELNAPEIMMVCARICFGLCRTQASPIAARREMMKMLADWAEIEEGLDKSGVTPQDP